MAERRGRVLDVGNCDPDHGLIRGLLTEHFAVDVDRVMFVEEALDRMRSRSYDLVLVNRKIFEDGSDGLDLVRRAKSEAGLAQTPVMLVSNYAEAQEAAVSAGAERGFGKAALGAPETVTLLGRFLPGR